MALPPKDISASELFLKLCESPRPSEVVDFPRNDPDTGKPIGQLRIQVLDMPQHDEARIRAHKWLREEKGISKEDLASPLLQEVYGDRVAREVLIMACLSVEPIKGTAEVGSPKYARVFRTTEELEKAKITADELTVIFSMYEMVQHRYGPMTANIGSDDELNAWIDRLSKGAASFPLSGQSWHQLAALSMSLAERVSLQSDLLESLLKSSVITSDAQLESWGIGIGSYGEDVADSTVNGAEQSQVDPSIPEEPITQDMAVQISKQLFHKG